LIKILPNHNDTVESTRLVIGTTTTKGRRLDVEHIMYGLHEVEVLLVLDVEDALHAEDPSIGTSKRFGCAMSGNGASTISKAIEETVQEAHEVMEVHLAREREAIGGEDVGRVSERRR
jgi:hypothetical protein